LHAKTPYDIIIQIRFVKGFFTVVVLAILSQIFDMPVFIMEVRFYQRGLPVLKADRSENLRLYRCIRRKS